MPIDDVVVRSLVDNREIARFSEKDSWKAFCMCGRNLACENPPQEENEPLGIFSYIIPDPAELGIPHPPLLYVCWGGTP